MARYQWADPLAKAAALVALAVGGGLALDLFRLSAEVLLPLVVVVLVSGFIGMHYSRVAERSRDAAERQHETGGRPG